MCISMLPFLFDAFKNVSYFCTIKTKTVINMHNKLKLAVLAVAFAAVASLFVSCSKESKMEGKWKVTKVASLDSDAIFDDQGTTWLLREYGSCNIALLGSHYDGKWYVDDDDLTIYLDKVGDCRIVGDFDIEKLDNDDMSLSGEWTAKWDDGTRSEINVVYNLVKK